MLMYSTRNLTYNPCSIGKKYIFYIYKIKNADIHMKKKGERLEKMWKCQSHLRHPGAKLYTREKSA